MGDGQAVRLPHGFEFSADEVAIRRDGEAVILEPIKLATWPENFFDAIRVDDATFERPEQGAMPAIPQLDSP